VLRIGLLLTAAFVAAAVAAYAVPAVRGGHWAGLHLSLAGAALVAVGTFMPHFGVALAGATPESPRLRLAGVTALASGAVLVVGGVLTQAPAIAATGAAGIWLGLAVTAWTTLRPRMQPLARRHPVAQVAYAVALVEVAIGIGLPVLMLLGWEPAVAGWVRLKPAHVWLNLFGFVSLTISATLVYLYPTILGARIRAIPAVVAMVGGGIAGPPLVAVAAGVDSQPLGVAGVAITLLGAGGQVAYGVDVWRRRGRWTTDSGWHRLTSWHLSAAMGWYLLAVAGAAVVTIRDGPAPGGWSLGALAVPLVAGWVLQVLAGAWSHLLPAVGSTNPAVGARRRAVLGLAARPRAVAWNAGVLLAWLGLAADYLPLAAAGVVAFAIAALLAVGLLGWALLGDREAAGDGERGVIPRTA
jgi:nitrite reductase (NO-forming)